MKPAGAKTLNDALRGKRSERHEDKRSKEDRKVSREEVSQFIEKLRKKRDDQTQGGC